MSDAARQAGAAGAAVAGAGAAVGAAAATACCMGPIAAPLVVGVLGVGGAAWAASLRPYSLYILLAAIVPLGGAFWLAYRAGRPEPEAEPTCRPRPPVWLRGVLWGSAVLWVVSLGLNLILPA